MFTTNVAQVYQNYLAKLAAKDKLDKEIGELRENLKTLIPDNQSVAGVYHKVIQRKNVKYSEALSQIIANVVAESKRGRAWTLVESFTTYSDVHSYEPAKDSTLAKKEDLA